MLARPFRYRTQCFLGCESVRIETELKTLEELPRKSTAKSASNTGKDDSAEANNAARDESPKSPTLLEELPALLATIDIKKSIEGCQFTIKEPTRVYYAADKLYKAGKADSSPDGVEEDSNEETDE